MSEIEKYRFLEHAEKVVNKIGECVKQVRRHLPVHLHGYKSFSRDFFCQVQILYDFRAKTVTFNDFG